MVVGGGKTGEEILSSDLRGERATVPCLEEGSGDVHPCIGWSGQDGLSGLEELLCVGEGL